MATATQIGVDLWGQQNMQWGATAMRADMAQPASTLQSATAEGPKRRKKKDDAEKPQHAHVTMNYVNVERWFTDLQNLQQPPNSRQMAVLQGVRARCEQEAREMHGASSQ